MSVSQWPDKTWSWAPPCARAPKLVGSQKKKNVGTESGSSTCGGGGGLRKGRLSLSTVQLCNGRPAGIHSKVSLQVQRWAGSGFEKGGYIVFKCSTHQSCSQFDSAMRVWKVLIAFPGLIPSKPPAKMPLFANVRIRLNFFALQHFLLRWKPSSPSRGSAGSRFRRFGSVASKSRGARIYIPQD